jgi:dienelactone hydrolase
MTLQIRKIEYQDEMTLLEGYCAWDDHHSDKRPAVIIAHDWSGRNDFVSQKAEQLAAQGYVAFALDMYGKGKLGQTNEQKSALIAPFMADRALLRRRVLAAFNTVKQLENVDTTRIAAMGFCFGGLVVLDLARSGVDICGVVSLHGLLIPPAQLTVYPPKAKILVLHGHDDPMVTMTDLIAFQKEMTDLKVDWQVHIYSHTMHAFTNPLANDAKLGTVYNALSDQRSNKETCDFFADIFAKS